jgi:heat-inducible transcriptional repressor
LELDDRKWTILNAIIRNYLETGEPVGSRTISKFTDLNLSSATIRNEMSDLEEMGYITSPHTSAGRIPTDKAYRLYVDKMMESKDREIKEIKTMLLDKADKMENLLEQATKLLASSTNYTAMVTTPMYRSKKVKFVQLTEVAENSVLVVILIEGNIVKNKVIEVSKEIEPETMLKLNLMLNSFLQGLDLSEINLEIIGKMKKQSEGLGVVVNDVLDAVAQALSEEEKVKVYTSGATNILKYPELSSGDNASDILYEIEEKKELTELMKKDDGDGNPIRVYIGDEVTVDSMKDCSVVTATYELSDGMYGKFGIVGPKRMDYEKVVSALTTIKNQIDELIKK